MALGLAHQLDHPRYCIAAAMLALDRPELGGGDSQDAAHASTSSAVRPTMLL